MCLHEKNCCLILFSLLLFTDNIVSSTKVMIHPYHIIILIMFCAYKMANTKRTCSINFFNTIMMK